MLRKLCSAAALCALLAAGGARADYFYKTAAGTCPKGEMPEKRGSSAACVPAHGMTNCSKGRKIEHYDRLNKSVCVDDPHAAKGGAATPPAARPIHTKSGQCHEHERLARASTGQSYCEPVGRCGNLRRSTAAPGTGFKKMCIDQ